MQILYVVVPVTGSPNWPGVTAAASFARESFRRSLPAAFSLTRRAAFRGAMQPAAGLVPQPNGGIVVVVVEVVVVVVVENAAQSGSAESTRPSPSLSRPTKSGSNDMSSSALEHGCLSPLKTGS